MASTWKSHHNSSSAEIWASPLLPQLGHFTTSTQQSQAMRKWLLRMNDLVGPDLPLTQEFLAHMMGVSRTTVTEVAGKLQKCGLISYSRGHIHIRDLEQIRASAC